MILPLAETWMDLEGIIHILLDVLFSSSVATHSSVLVWEITWTEELGYNP